MKLKRIVFFLLFIGSLLFSNNESYAQLNLLKDNKTCLYGYTNENGEWIVQPQFVYAQEFYDGYAEVGTNGEKGLLDADGSVLIPLQYDYILREENWFTLKHDTLYDLFDITSQKIVLKDYPNKIIYYKNNYLLFEKQEKYGLSVDNTILIQNAYRLEVNSFDQSAVVHYGPEDNDSIRIYLIPQRKFTADTYTFIQWNSKDNYIVKKGKYYGIIDCNGKTVVPFAYTHLYERNNILDLIILRKKSNKGYDVFTNTGQKLNKKPYQYVDSTLIIKHYVYIATQKNKQGVLNSNGELIPCVYDSISYEDSGNYSVYLLYSSKGVQVADAAGKIFHKGYYTNISMLKPLYTAETEYRYEEFVPPCVISILPDTSVIVLNIADSTEYLPGTGYYLDASYRLYSNGKYGMITAGQEHVIPPVYDFIFPFQTNHSYTTILQGEKFGIIDLDAHVVVQPEYLFISENPLSEESFIFMTENYLFGIKNTEGEILVEPVYTALSGYDPEKDYCWAHHSDSTQLRLIGADGTLKNMYDFVYPMNLSISARVVIQASIEDSYSETNKTGVLDCNTFQPIVPFIYERIAPVNDSIYMCTTDENYNDSTYADLYIHDMRIDSVTGCSLLPDQIIAVERCYNWQYFKNGNWLLKPGIKHGIFSSDITELVQMQSQTISSYKSDLNGGDYEIILEFDTTHTTISKLLNYEIIRTLSNNEKRTFNNLYENYVEDKLVVFDLNYVNTLRESIYTTDEEMYYGSDYGGGGSDQITAIVHTPSFGEIRFYGESWERASFYEQHKTILYTLSSNNELKELSLADITNHLHHTTILSTLLNLQLDSLKDIQLPCADRENILDLATGYQFEKEGLLFYFNDERSGYSSEYEEIEVLLAYDQLIRYFKNSVYLSELYKNSLKQ